MISRMADSLLIALGSDEFKRDRRALGQSIGGQKSGLAPVVCDGDLRIFVSRCG